jgi:2-dehydro-3-deoxyphosphooctonate aldolase (KDO 8-P synthase)
MTNSHSLTYITPKKQTSIRFTDFEINNANSLVLIAGPCQMESRNHTLIMAEHIAKIAAKIGIHFIFKTSFDKANRTSVKSHRGVGLEVAIDIFSEVREKIGCPVITDVHEVEQINKIAEVVDVIQIPALLCRQTDLILAAAKTQKVINVKKGQFLAPWDMENVAKKISHVGNNKILITERGTSFGYNTLINDMRGLQIMKQIGYPVIFDTTHSVQQPGGLGVASGGQREFIAPLARAATAVGIAGLFIETHDNPDKAPCDGPCMLPLGNLQALLEQVCALDKVVKNM